ncbi:phosphoribosylglycinamide formyltransferase [Phycisphaera mikurensis]|uniref:Phosphoribosylglycinamide formyltransferase n=1 Tax=Phycisphaera mikurensis (strain NBRC 102666 / KCTC 22515 / FYK2301M01) TaxID=1142394 RepID=I0IFF4_PHYMF|nr:phosphoribosylglycinamide formyltransferase [Phycisphaera mikurensis]MBB6440616.1 phosphoribosylglycinamide formyltransferase-1 [Phycisphaera mikurensis]BAM03992.1 phosphoribosylglycinamide formyltransferase [Phycisphaera mikurensis NBRC 102666]
MSSDAPSTPPLRLPPAVRRPRLGVLISGGGTTLLNLQDEIDAGRLDAEIVAVTASRADAVGLARAKQRGLPVADPADKPAGVGLSEHVFGYLRDHRVDLVCLAGFLSLLHIPEDHRGRVLNIHPSLLPAFGGLGMYGNRVHRAVLESGVRVSGCTVHLADEAYDTGPILVQRCCPVETDDTADSLKRRVWEQEKTAFPDAIRLVAGGRHRLEGRRLVRA